MKPLWPKDNAQNLSILVLMLLTLCTYSQLVLHPFFWIDDLTYISRNLMVKHGFNKESMVWAFSTLFYGNWCPITWIVHMLDVELFGLWAPGHHLSSLFLHLLNTFLIFMFLNKATSSFGKAFWVALLFALHPLHVEAVAWASSKKDLLSGFFGSLFLISYLRYTSNRSKQSYLLCLVLYLLGLASKSSLIPFAFILLVLDYWPLGRISFEELSNFKGRFWKLFIEKIPFLILSIIFALLTSSAQKLAGAHDLMPKLSVWKSLGNACFFVLSYILKTLWPFRALGFPYPYYNFDPLSLGLFALLLILILLYVLRFGVKYPWLFAGFFFFLLGIFPYLQLQQTGHQQMADRWMYLPVLGLFIALVWSFGSILEKHGKLLHLKWATFLFAGVLTVSCWMQVSYWKTPESLLRHTISLSSGNHMAYVYLSSGLEMENRVKEALEEAKKGWSIAPTFKTFERIIGSLNRAGQAAESIHYLRNTEYEDPVFTLLEKAQIYSILASYPDSREAYRKFFGSDPFEVCIETSKAGLELDKENSSFQTLIAAALMKLNKDSEAEIIFKRVLEVQPKRSENHANIAA
ncbi:MAG: hypothetical protein GYA55_05800, partial [SAR324 cluster bacterium]|nr:hypothetical protein [SAR324 cluster bacterium]